MPSHCWWKPCVFTIRQPPPEVCLSYCPYSYTHIPLSPTENSWDYISWTKNTFPSFSGATSGLPENTARFWNLTSRCLGFPLQFQIKGATWVLWTLFEWDHEETIHWPLSILKWRGRWSHHQPVSQWAFGTESYIWVETWEVRPNLMNHPQSSLIWQSEAWRLKEYTEIYIQGCSSCCCSSNILHAHV